jgi:hypothetical protein
MFMGIFNVKRSHGKSEITKEKQLNIKANENDEEYVQSIKYIMIISCT